MGDGEQTGHRGSVSAALGDGTYDVLVVDADNDDRGTTYELTVLGGAHKGEVVAVRGPAVADPLDQLGLPGTLIVTNGHPVVRLD